MFYIMFKHKSQTSFSATNNSNFSPVVHIQERNAPVVVVVVHHSKMMSVEYEVNRNIKGSFVLCFTC